MMINLFKSNKMDWDHHAAQKDEGNIDNDEDDEDESIVLEFQREEDSEYYQ